MLPPLLTWGSQVSEGTCCHAAFGFRGSRLNLEEGGGQGPQGRVQVPLEGCQLSDPEEASLTTLRLTLLIYEMGKYKKNY